MGSRAVLPELESWLATWASDLTSPGLSFLIYKMEITTGAPYKVVVRVKGINALQINGGTWLMLYKYYLLQNYLKIGLITIVS